MTYKTSIKLQTCHTSKNGESNQESMIMLVAMAKKEDQMQTYIIVVLITVIILPSLKNLNLLRIIAKQLEGRYN